MGPSAESSWILWNRFDYAIVFAFHDVCYISVLMLFVALKSETVHIVVLAALRLQISHEVVIWKNTIPLAWFPYNGLNFVGDDLAFHTFILFPSEEFRFRLSFIIHSVHLLLFISKPARYFVFQILLRFWFMRQRWPLMLMIRARGPFFLYAYLQRLHAQLFDVNFDIIIWV